MRCMVDAVVPGFWFASDGGSHGMVALIYWPARIPTVGEVDMLCILVYWQLGLVLGCW